MELTVKHIHTYQELVKTQAVLPLCCGECDEQVFPGMDKDEKVFLECYSCNNKFYPGLRIKEIILNVTNHDG